MEDFDILVVRDGEGFRADVRCQAVGDFLGGALSRDDIRDLRERAQEFFDHGQHSTEAAQYIGTVLHNAVLRSSPAALADAIRSAGRVRVNLVLTPDAELLELPWELWYDGQFVALRDDVELARYVPLRRARPAPAKCRTHRRILFTSAAPVGREPLDLDAELSALERALEGWTNNGAVLRSYPGSFRKLKYMLGRAGVVESPFHVWHHAGHGEVAGDQFKLILEGEGRRAEPVEAEEVAAFLDRLEKSGGVPELIVINTCHGASPHALVPALARLNVAHVIGHRRLMSDKAAICFAEALYRALDQDSVAGAVRSARNALYLSAHTRDWAVPLYFSRARVRPRPWSQFGG